MRVCLFPRVQSTTAHTSDQADAARELIHATSLVNILRTDAEQASQIADRLPEDLPKELSSQFRSAIDQNLAYDKMEAALIKSVAASVDLATLENSLRWWASDSGRAVAKAESSAYAELFPGSTFQGYNPNSTASRDLNATELAELMGTGGFPQNIADVPVFQLQYRPGLRPRQTCDRQRWPRATITARRDRGDSRLFAHFKRRLKRLFGLSSLGFHTIDNSGSTRFTVGGRTGQLGQCADAGISGNRHVLSGDVRVTRRGHPETGNRRHGRWRGSSSRAHDIGTFKARNAF
jgi:hypothetical protein